MPRWWVRFVGAGVAAIAIYLSLSGSAREWFYAAFAVAAAGAVAAGAFRQPREGRRPWLLMAAGFACFAAGEVVYSTYAEVIHRTPPVPSLADVFYFAAYPILAVGLTGLLRGRGAGRDRAGLLDALIVTTVAAMAMWIFLIDPTFDASGTLAPKLIATAYPLMDLLLLGVAVRVVTTSSGARLPGLLLGAAILGLVATDLAFAVLTLHDAYQVGGLLDAGWLASYVLWAAAALHPLAGRLAEPGHERDQPAPSRRLVLLGVATAAGPLMLASGALGHDHNDRVAGPVLAGALGLLLLTRLLGLIRSVARARSELARALEREQVLRGAASDLVVARSRDDMGDAARRAASELVAGVPGVEIVTSSATPAGDGHLDLAGLLAVSGSSRLPAVTTRALEALATELAMAVERARLTDELNERHNEARFRSMVQGLSDAITVIDADTTIRYVSPAARRIFGVGADALVGLRLTDAIGDEHRAGFTGFLEALLSPGGREGAVDRWQYLHPDGTTRELETKGVNLLADEHVAGIVLTTSDVTERRRLEAELRHQAFHDTLTGLANRELFANLVEHAIARGARTGACHAVLLLDVDDFKTVNDSLGHPAGDRLLVTVAERIRACVRPGDTTARLGGDEFAVLAEDLDEHGAAALADRIVAALSEPVVLEGAEIFVSGSAGLTLARGTPRDADVLLREADAAMYAAKRAGKRGWELYLPAMHDRASRRLEMRGDLQRALRDDQFVLHYQPVVELATGAIEGFEALVRWLHPERGLVPPGDFIALAEETGLIVPLGRWVLGEACRQAATWRRQYPGHPIGVAVNVSARQLDEAGFVGDVGRALRASGLPAELLTLELTESVLGRDGQTTELALSTLSDLGVRLAIDDFGTGYSSLGRLHDYPVDVLKIDKRFVDAIATGPDGDAMARTVVELANTLLHVEALAEGVEHQAQADALREMGCRLGQGYWFSRPVDGDTATALLAGASLAGARSA